MDMNVQAGDRPTRPAPRMGGEELHPRRISIATLVVIFLAIIATCMLVAMGWFNYHFEVVKEREKLRQILVQKADQLKEGLSLPLWNFDYPQVGKILDSAMQDRNLYGVNVKQIDPVNAQEFVTYARIRDAQWHVVPTELEIPPEALQVEERTIMAMGEPIGRVKVFLTTRFLDQEMRLRMSNTIGLTLVFDLLLIASLYFLLWKVVLKPLRAIERYATAVRVSWGTGKPAPIDRGDGHPAPVPFESTAGEGDHPHRGDRLRTPGYLLEGCQRQVPWMQQGIRQDDRFRDSRECRRQA
jgi:hypothetical protein